eukprot:TCALIF_01106-PA protein Name:"Similar to Thada Thyroid adenoma-associated protein homolog (Mus musculus)" AED:0.68 eAED:0.68 QI:0/0/0/0.16/1/1/12/0/1922
MSSEVTLNLRTSVPKMAPQPRAVVVKPAENLAVSLAQIQELFHPDVGGSCSTSVSLQFEPPDAMERLASWLEALRHATKFSDQVAVLDQVMEDDHMALGLFLTFPPSSHLLNRIRKQLTQTSEVDALSRPLVSILTVLARQNESILGPALGRCLESGPITKQIVVAASEQFMPLVLNQILSMNPGVFNQEPQFTSLIRALGQLSSLGNIDPPPKSTLKALADLTRAPETSMDHKLNFCLPVCRWMLLTHDVLITCQSMVADLELDHDPSAEVCFIQAFIVSCRPKMFREQGPKAVDRILVLTKKHPSGPVLLQVSRFAVQFLKRIKAEFTSSSDMEMDLEKCSSQLEDLLWILFESKIESVRHNTCNALAALISILQHKDKQHLDGILRRIVSMNSRSKIRCLALLQVLKALPWTGTLDKLLDESIQNEVTALFEDVHLKKYAIELYEALLVSSHQGSTESPQEWREHWLPPLFQASHEPEIEHLITKVWRLCPDYFDNVNSTHQPTDSDPKSQKIFLLVIKSKKSSNKAKYEDFLDLKVYVHSFLAFNDDVRLLAFESLITSRKGAEPYTKRELEIVLKQSMENMNLETNWAKERYMSLNKKFCCRLSASWDAMVNQMGLDYLSAFVQDLRKIYFQSLFPEANPPRRAMALESIRIVREALSKQFQPARDQFEGSILIKVLGDSFESNKRLALNLLQDFNSDQLSLATSSQVGPIIDKCRIMQRSTNPAHSLEAAYLVLLLSKQCGYKQYLGIEDATQEDVITFTIQRLLRDLTDQLSVARSNLSQAAQTHPMYGVLLNLRMFFEFKLISKSGCFGDELEALFNLMTDIHEVILPVLQSDAPEGVTFETDASSSDAQALLLCAWRTSKEISLLMTSLAKVYLLTNQHEHLCGIFRFLCDSLSVLKHRGAFEQAHLAFATLCQALGGSKRLKSLVDTELAKVLQAISNGESLCSTRRSAGLPFLILSLVSAQGREDRSGTLSSVMQSLFSNAEDPDIPVASRVNALHILRALFRANAFGDDMYTFTEQGLITTISGCNSNLWEVSQQNRVPYSVTLLVHTLVTRIFGVKRDKDEFSQKNAITTRMFFQKHPRLFHIFKAMLQNLVECLDKGRGSTWPQESVCVPILVLLAKLKPAPISTGVDQFPVSKLPSDILEIDVSSLRRRSRTLPIYEPSEQDEINRFIPPKSIQENVEFPKIESDEENNEPNPPPLPERKSLSLPAIGPHLPLDLGQPPLLPPKRKLPSLIEKKPPPSKLNSSERPPLPEKPNAIKMRPLDSDVPHQPLSGTKSNPTSLAHEERPALPPKYKRRPGPRSDDELSNKKETFKAQKSVKEIRSQFESIETSSTTGKSGPNDRRLRRRPSSVVVPKLNTEIQTWLRLVSKTNPDLNRVIKVVEKNHRILGVQDLCGYTGLHWLCKQGSFEAVDRLFKANLVHRSDLNARSRGGYTALMLCAIQRHSKLYNMMREQPNLDLSMRDYSGRTAEHFYGEDQEEDLTDGRRDRSGGESLRCVVCRIFFHSLELIQFDESTRTPDMLLELNRGLLLQHENLIADPESCRDIAAFHFRSLTVDLFAAIALRFEVNLEDMILMFRFGPESSRMSILRQLGNSQSHFVLSQFIPLLLDSCLSSGSVILEPQHNEFYECILEVINKWLTRVERDNVKNLSSSHLNRLQELVTISINRETMKEQEDEEAEATTARALETEDKSARLMWFSPQLVCLASKLNSWNKINSSAFWDFLLQATSHNGLDTDEQSALAIVQCLQYFHQQTQNPTLLDWQDSLVWYLVLTLCYHNNWNVRNAMCQFYLAMFPLESHSPPSQLGPNFIRRIQCNFGTIGGVLRFLQDLADDHFQEERDDSIFDQSAAQNWRENHLIRSDLKETCMDFILKSDVDLLALQNSAGLCEGLNSKAALLTYFDTSYKSETG